MSKVSAFGVVALGVAVMSGDVLPESNALKLTLGYPDTVAATYNPRSDRRRLHEKVGDALRGGAGIVGSGLGSGVRAASAPGRFIGNAIKKAVSESGSESSVRTSQQRSRSDPGQVGPSGIPPPPSKAELARFEELKRQERQAEIDAALDNLSKFKRGEPPVETRGITDNVTRNKLSDLGWDDDHLRAFTPSAANHVVTHNMERTFYGSTSSKKLNSPVAADPRETVIKIPGKGVNLPTANHKWGFNLTKAMVSGREEPKLGFDAYQTDKNRAKTPIALDNVYKYVNSGWEYVEMLNGNANMREWRERAVNNFISKKNSSSGELLCFGPSINTNSSQW
jgi:hypothetical protein